MRIILGLLYLLFGAGSFFVGTALGFVRIYRLSLRKTWPKLIYIIVGAILIGLASAANLLAAQSEELAMTMEIVEAVIGFGFVGIGFGMVLVGILGDSKSEEIDLFFQSLPPIETSLLEDIFAFWLAVKEYFR